MQRDFRKLSGPRRFIPSVNSGTSKQGSGGKYSTGDNIKLDWLIRMSLAAKHPRTLSFTSQVCAGMWRKNGRSLEYMMDAYYRQAPDSTFELDVKALHVGVCAVGQ